MTLDRHVRTGRVVSRARNPTQARRLGYVLAALVLFGCEGARESHRAAATQLSRFRFEHAAMGTRFVITLYAAAEEAARNASAAAFRRIDDIEHVATDYDASSEARSLSRSALDAGTRVSPDLARVLRAADDAVLVSAGAFDPTIGAVTRLWRRALRRREWPTPARWDEACEAVGWQRLVRLSERQGGLHVQLLRPGMRLDFGGVAKGVAVDVALEKLTESGIVHALVDGGGDLAASAPPPDAAGWTVSVRPFGDADGVALSFELTRGAIATSGDAYQGAVLTGDPLPAFVSGLAGPESPELQRRYGHVLDPRGVLPLRSPRAAVMTAPSAARADALATALLVLGRDLSAPSSDLQRGLFFDAVEAPPCVGASFPQDGVRLAPTGRAPGDPRDADRASPLPRDE